DGDFSDRLTHPRHKTAKVYLVKVRGVPRQPSLDRLRRGVVLDGRRTAPCAIEERRVSGERLARKNSWWQVTLSEGRTRQIRRMFERIGHPVQRLKRTAIGSLRDGRLATGTHRELTEAEVDRLMAGEPLRLSARDAAAKESAARARKITKKRAVRKSGRKKSARRGESSERRRSAGTAVGPDGAKGRSKKKTGAKGRTGKATSQTSKKSRGPRSEKPRGAKGGPGGRSGGRPGSKAGGARKGPGPGGGRRGGSPRGRKGPR
ncbi:MAG: pseudouridine synthase, partial [Acidobacteriota bacterium]